MNVRPTTLLPLLGVLVACDPAERSDSEQYYLDVDLVDQLGLDSHRVLVGTTFTLSMQGVAGGGPYELDCVATSTTGGMSKLGSTTYSVDAAGPGTVEFAAPDASCPHLAELMPDRWSAIGVEVSATAARWIPAGDSTVVSHRGSPGPAGTFPAALGRPLDHARVAADGRFVLYPTLVDPSAGERAEVRWQDVDAALTVPDQYRWATMAKGGDLLDGRLLAGESFTPMITILGNELELPRVEAVPVDAIVDLQLVPVYMPSYEPEREWGVPIGVVALALDGGGHRILGAPIDWSVTRGDLHETSDNTLAQVYGDDVIQLLNCGASPAQPQWRSASVEARVAGRVASAQLEWLALPGDLENACASDSEEDDDGSSCECSATVEPREAALAVWPLLALAAIRRRRSAA